MLFARLHQLRLLPEDLREEVAYELEYALLRKYVFMIKHC